ncbi:MAG: hypothetical protein MUC41_05215 [Syntrophobacteraceae bacterium]|nr:hypothetical protein [Syntrophobacteraceae bacterium]
MDRDIECMCMNCGVSLYIAMGEIALDDSVISCDHRMVRNLFCTECGGALAMIGLAGEQPRYRLE